MHLELLNQAPRFGWLKDLIESRQPMGVYILHDQDHLLSRGIRDIEEVANEAGARPL
jgi:hypothetical protein